MCNPQNNLGTLENTNQDKMADDFDLSLSPIKKSAPTKGRRANASAGKAFEDDDEEFLVSSTLKSRPVSGELFLDEDIGKKNYCTLLYLIFYVKWVF